MSAQTADTAIAKSTVHTGVVGGESAHRAEVPRRELARWRSARLIVGLGQLLEAFLVQQVLKSFAKTKLEVIPTEFLFSTPNGRVFRIVFKFRRLFMWG